MLYFSVGCLTHTPNIMDIPNSDGDHINGATPQAESDERSSIIPAKPNLENAISELELELIAIAGHLERLGLESVELAGLQEAYSDITFALQALIKQWEDDHKKPGDSR